MRWKGPRILLLVLLLLSGFLLHLGCSFPLPMREVPVDFGHDSRSYFPPDVICISDGFVRNDVDYRPLIGQPDSNKPIRPGVISKKQVLEKLGKPWISTPDGNSLAYVYIVKKSVEVIPLCGFATIPKTSRAFGYRLDFAESGDLTQVKTEELDDSRSGVPGYLFQLPKNWTYHGFAELAEKLISVESNQHKDDS